MRNTTVLAGLILLLLALAAFPAAVADEPEDDTGQSPDSAPPTPPNMKKKEPRPIPDRLEEELITDPEAPWGLPDEMLAGLAEKARVYASYARRFLCTETAREADYKNGEAQKEKKRRYSYLLVAEPDGRFEESRRVLTDQGKVRKAEVEDEEHFPPAYAWVYLFSQVNQPYFAYRVRNERFDGFDWVRDIEFRGALPFTDGKDIRQWEGIAVVNVVTNTPIEITAEPATQRERMRYQFDRWARSFNLVGFRLGPKPLGYRCKVDFRYIRDGLNFPTRLRYDTFRAVSLKRIVPWKVSSRAYSDYSFTYVQEDETVGETVDDGF